MFNSTTNQRKHELNSTGNHLRYLNKITMITNFGTHNIKNVIELAKYAVQFSCWQIQLTIGNEFQLDLDEIKEHLNNKYVKELVLDFSKITYVASIGLRAILELHKIMQEKNCPLKLKNVNKDILQIFKTTGFDKFLTIENNSDNV